MTTIYNDSFYDLQSKESFESALIVLTKLRELLAENIELSSVVDFGCGVGSWLAAAKQVSFETVLGTDGDYVSRDKLMISKHEFIANDLSKPSSIALPLEKCDLALTLEVAEHLPEDAADDFVTKITSMSDLILFSAAIPYQGGHGHVNENWLEYWEDKFKSNGYVAVDLLRPMLWNNKKVCWWYRQNLIVFIKIDKLSCLPTGTPINLPLSIIHPEQYLLAVHREKTSRNFSLKQDISYLSAFNDKDEVEPQSYGKEYSYTESESKVIDTIEDLEAYAEQEGDAVLLDALAPIKHKTFDLNAFKASISPSHNSPDFLCVGAQKSGTTWLYEVLKQQKGIWMPPLKELNFFNQLTFESNSAYSGVWRREAALKRLHQATKNPKVDEQWLDFLFHLCKKNVDLDWYSNIFKRCPAGKLSGEITPEYMMLPIEGIQAIKAMNANMKIIMVLRNPIDRIESHLKMIKSRCVDLSDEVLAAVAEQKSVVYRSEYTELLKNWCSVFDRKNIFIISFDTIEKEPTCLIKELGTFLNTKVELDSRLLNRKIHKSNNSDLSHLVDLKGRDMIGFENIDFDI
ncbi:sulfotransferase domain-containing protein [uncultured Paraglaciecola sp.]|uniref:sulfotransferase domain-containing protein n=1 Tax=uncultured Paraglaciecola sp. TaxID=1765024 RepID=UPI002598A8A1|nr:sulfotransferase domain-containing protein [uncultured Paraglaciecola sp.]